MMIDVLVWVGLVASGFGVGWAALPVWMRYRMNKKAELMKLESRERRSASAKVAAERRKVRALSQGDPS
jgi:hypothetical protein